MKSRESELSQAENENRLTPSGYQELQSLRKTDKQAPKPVLALKEVIEDIANWNNVYGCGEEKFINDGHPDDCRCRICYTIGLEEKIMTAVYGEERNMFQWRIMTLQKGESVVIQISPLYGFAFVRSDDNLELVLGAVSIHTIENFFNRFK